MKINVTGNLWDHLGQKIPDNRQPELLFVPVQSNVIGNALVAGYEAKATVNTDGTFSAELEADPDTEFRIEARWLANDATDPELQAMQRAEWPSTYQLYPGGDIAALIPPNSDATDDALLDKGIMLLSRGYIGTTTDANEMFGERWAGDWTTISDNILNGPPVGFNATWLVKIRVGSVNVTEQEWCIVDRHEKWRRIATDAGTWGEYEEVGWKQGRALPANLPTLDDLPEGYHQIWSGSDAASYGLPVAVPGELTIWKFYALAHATYQVFTGGRIRIYTARRDPSAGWEGQWRELAPDPEPSDIVGLAAATSRGFKQACIPCTLGGSQGGTVTGEGFVRVQQRFPAGASRVRIRIRNVNPRREDPDSPAVTVSNVSIGAYTTGDNADSWTTIDTEGSTGTEGYVSPWITVPAELAAGGDVLVAYGWQSTGDVKETTGTGWTGALSADALTGTGSSASQLPGFVSIEVEVPASTPVVAAFGDSIASGIGTSKPTYNSWIDQWAVGKDVIPTHWSHGGDTAAAWQDPTSPKWTIYGTQIALADAVIYAMGSNDIFSSAGTPTLADMQERTRTAVEIMRRWISPNVYGATVTPRSGVTGAAEDLRRAYNAWLPESGLFRDVFDLSAAVSTDDETIMPEYDPGDGVHINTPGNAAMAAAVNRPIVA